MTQATERHEIDHHTLKLIVGIIAISLPFLVSWFADAPQSERVGEAGEVVMPASVDGETVPPSSAEPPDCDALSGSLDEISAAYHRHNTASDIFVGFLFAISAFLFAYNGRSKKELVMSKIAGVAALGVALFPCACTDHTTGESYTQHQPFVHFGSAAVMFIILALFCNVFRRRARGKGHARARMRALIYTVCGLTIVAAIILMGIDGLTASKPENNPGFFSERAPRFIFYGEAIGLIAFGISWLTASCMLPGITSKQERIPLRSRPQATNAT